MLFFILSIYKNILKIIKTKNLKKKNDRIKFPKLDFPSPFSI